MIAPMVALLLVVAAFVVAHPPRVAVFDYSPAPEAWPLASDGRR